MRHSKHRHQLGVKKAHRQALMANMAAALIRHSQITTTLAKAKALRPFVEKNITLAKRAKASDNAAKSLHCRRLAIASIRDKEAVKILFDEKVEEFIERKGGYTRIYKLGHRRGDAAEMAIIEFVEADDEGYSSRKKSKSGKKKATKKVEAKADTVEAEVTPVKEEVKAEAISEKEEPKAEVVPPAKEQAEGTDSKSDTK